MNSPSPTLAQLCAEFASASQEVIRLSGISPAYRSDEHPYMLEEAMKRRNEAQTEIRRRILEANHG